MLELAGDPILYKHANVNKKSHDKLWDYKRYTNHGFQANCNSNYKSMGCINVMARYNNISRL